MVMFDVPKSAYETWAIYCMRYDENGKPHEDYEREERIALSLQQHKFDRSHEHIRHSKGG